MTGGSMEGGVTHPYTPSTGGINWNNNVFDLHSTSSHAPSTHQVSSAHLGATNVYGVFKSATQRLITLSLCLCPSGRLAVSLSERNEFSALFLSDETECGQVSREGLPAGEVFRLTCQSLASAPV